MSGRLWTANEIDYLQESWGTVPVQKIANHLNRTVYAVERKAINLRLGPFLDNGDYITINQLYKSLGFSNGNLTRWVARVEKRNFPIKLIRIKSRKLKVVHIEDFWKWAEVNQDILDLSKLEPLILGKEPKWLMKKRKQDSLRTCGMNKAKQWTTYDDMLLIGLLKENIYTYNQIAKLINRTPKMIESRINKLKIPYRPIDKAIPKDWTDANLTDLRSKINDGYTRQELAIYFNRTVAAIDGKLFQLFGTKSLQKIKEYLRETV